ncbi:MAG: MFS transporter, partial [Alphaproteobacteria bacterium]|nr:MFS transporter [Alphaproteobacteria bacterium]
LIMLMVVFTFSHMDRNIVAILLNSITQDLKLSDTQAGLMAGFAFAIFYATLGLPIARVADRTNRMNIITIALALWSAMTALCGLAQNFWQLLLARMGVGVGEAGCVPPAQSIIADYVPKEKRSFAMSVFALGVPLGTLLGFVIGGIVSELHGWRVALMVVGLPGVLLAVIVKLTIKEPPRGHADGLVDEEGAAPHMKEVARFLWTRKTLKHATAGAALITFGGYGAQTWIPAFFERSHGLSELQVGLWLAPVMVAGGMGGALLSG